MDLIFKKCFSCGKIVRMMNDSEVENIVCCNQPMETLIPNSVEASVEKHMPVIEVKGSEAFITVPHVMTNEHHIAWVIVQYEHEIREFSFPNLEEIHITVPYEKGAKVYSYCNLHGLWSNEMDNVSA